MNHQEMPGFELDTPAKQESLRDHQQLRQLVRGHNRRFHLDAHMVRPWGSQVHKQGLAVAIIHPLWTKPI